MDRIQTPDATPTPATRVDGLEALFKALADKTRLRILALLSQGELCVCNINESLKIPQPTASRHLAYLRKSGLVHARRDGVWVHYSVAWPEDPAARSLLEGLLESLGPIAVVEACVPGREDDCCDPSSLE